MTAFFEHTEFWASRIFDQATTAAEKLSRKVPLARQMRKFAIAGTVALAMSGSVQIPGSNANRMSIPPGILKVAAATSYVYRATASATSLSQADRLQQVITTIRGFAQFERNWDGNGGVPATLSATKDAIGLLRRLPPDVPLPWVSLGGDGEIGFFWKSDTIYADVGFPGKKRLSYYVELPNRRLEQEAGWLTDKRHVDPLIEALIEGSSPWIALKLKKNSETLTANALPTTQSNPAALANTEV